MEEDTQRIQETPDRARGERAKLQDIPIRLMFSWSKMKEGYFLSARHGVRADVGIKEQLELDMRQTHVGENTQPYNPTVATKGVVL